MVPLCYERGTMRAAILIPALAALFVVPAVAQNSPRLLGVFGNWSAAVSRDRGQKLCYAYTAPTRMSHRRNEVYLSVLHGSAGRNQVGLMAGYRYPRGASVAATVGRTQLPFYADGDAAFARNGVAAVAAFRTGNEAVLRGPRAAGRHGTVEDRFSLRGFSAAYAAISRECPPRRRH